LCHHRLFEQAVSTSTALSLVAVNVPHDRRAGIARAIWPLSQIDFIDYWDIDRHLRKQRETDFAYLVSLFPAHRWEIEETVRELRRARPLVPIIAYAMTVDDWAVRVVRAMRAGANHLALHGFDDLQRVVTHVYADVSLAPACAEALTLVLPYVPSPAHTIVGLCTMRAARVLAVPDVARAIGTSTRSLHRLLRALDLPTPASTISWCRLFVAVYLIARRHEPVDHVAGALGFKSGTGLRNMLRRYVGSTPAAAARDPDAVSRLARLYREAGHT
jgi:AraC-like DNA-binding protein